ncbi:MAG: VacB/RNase II family 3'-5' exoribonuclease [Steroidobacteraceae bacterium]
MTCRASSRKEVLQAAERFGNEVRPSDHAHREDLRALPLVTIDGEDAQGLRRCRVWRSRAGRRLAAGGGHRRCEPPLRYGGVLDTEARNRATSVYFPDRVIPMLPERLSNHLCSLMPQVERLAFVCDMRVSKSGKLSRARFYEAVIRSHARLTYESAWDYLSNPEGARQTLAADVRSSLDALYQIYQALKGARDARGALDFRGAEVKARIGADGVIVGFHAPVRNDAHRLIEECMIAANVETAAALRHAKAGGLYRVHGLPEDKRVAELEKVLNALNVGTQFSEEPTPREYRSLVDRLAARPDGLLLEGLVIRSLAQAVYQATNIGHFGLALEEYAHFTSPIRRYPDLIVHRALKAALLPRSAAGHRYEIGELQALGQETSQRERRADDAARDVMAYLKCLYLQGRIGEEFDASISSALEFGLFVQLAQMPIDGLVHISAIPGDYWELDRGGLGLVGRRTGRRFRMGDAVRVRLSRVDLAQRQIDFELVEAGASIGHPTRGAGGAARGGSRRERRSQRRG